MSQAVPALDGLYRTILKEAESIQSFVIDELALKELLERSWRPVGKKIMKSLSGVIDFKKKTYSPQKGINFSVWIEPDMYDAELQKIWNKIEKQVRKYVSRSYDRAIEEAGKSPFSPRQAEQKSQNTSKLQSIAKSVSSIYAERKRKMLDRINEQIKQQYLDYAREHAIPDMQEKIAALGSLDNLRKKWEENLTWDLELDMPEIARAELERKMRLLAIKKAQAGLIDNLKDTLENQKDAGMAANLATAKAHNFGFLDWAEENDIEYYRIDAVLDAKTCDLCKQMDGKVFKISDALAYKEKWLSIAGDKEKLKEQTPFLSKKNIGQVTSVNLDDFLDPSASPLPPKLNIPGQQPPPKENIPASSAVANEIFDLFATFNPIDYNEVSGKARIEQYQYLESTFADWISTVTKEQEEAIRTYKGNAYKRINRYYREGKEPEPKYMEAIKNLEATFKNASLSQNTVGYRGIGGVYGELKDIIDKKTWAGIKGEELVLDKAVMSVSIEKEVALEFAEMEDNPDAVMFKVYIPKTSKSAIALDVFDVPHKTEMEVLIKNEARFKIISADKSTRTFEVMLME